MRKKIAVLYGGISAERDVSIASGQAIVKALQSQCVDVDAYDANPDNIVEILSKGYENVFIALHGHWGEDGVIQGALEAAGIAYTGSGVLACALAMDKNKTKQIWQTLGLPTPRYRVLHSVEDLSGLIDELGLPLFLKPVSEGSSVGVGKVNNANELASIYRYASQNNNTVLAEQFIDGDEITVAILADEALPCIRMQTTREFYDYKAKYEKGFTEYFCPSGLSITLEQQIQTLALQAYHALDCEGWARVDFLLDANNTPYLLEVNTVPGMTETSLVPQAAKAIGLSFAQLVKRILEAKNG